MYAPMALVNVNSITTGFGYNDLLLGQQFHIVWVRYAGNVIKYVRDLCWVSLILGYHGFHH
jgi:hypothetical protein